MVFLLICPCFFLFSQEKMHHDAWLPFFLVIESPDSNSAQIEKAMQSILNMGQKSFYPVKSRLEETHHPRYFYLLEKLKSIPEKEWSKLNYFRECYQKAKELHQQGKSQDALKIAQAILVLEPELEFRREIESFVSECDISHENPAELKTEIQFSQEFYPFDKDIVVEFQLKNSQDTPILLFASKNHGIVVEVKQKDYFMDGIEKSQTSTKLIPWSEEINLNPGAKRIFQINIPNPMPSVLSHRTWKISAVIPRCRLTKEKKYSYPKIFFEEKEISSFPDSFIYLLKNPLNSCLWALSLGYEKHLFFASFFVHPKERKQLIPRLIEKLNRSNSIAVVSFGILKRFTKQNFASSTEWENWWQARSSFWKE